MSSFLQAKRCLNSRLQLLQLFADDSTSIFSQNHLHSIHHSSNAICNQLRKATTASSAVLSSFSSSSPLSSSTSHSSLLSTNNSCRSCCSTSNGILRNLSLSTIRTPITNALLVRRNNCFQ